MEYYKTTENSFREVCLEPIQQSTEIPVLLANVQHSPSLFLLFNGFITMKSHEIQYENH